MYTFLGLCINLRKNYFTLVNVVKKEKIKINFDLKSPVIYKIVVLRIYKKSIFRVSKLYFKNKNYYFDDFKNKQNKIISNLESFKFDYFYSAYYKKKLFKRKRRNRKFKKKYPYTESWKMLKTYIVEIRDLEYRLLNPDDDFDNNFDDDFDDESN